MNDNVIQQVSGWLANAEAVVAFTGAGISTESGIPDFRSPGGIWSTSQPVYYDDFLASDEARYEYWRQKAAAHRDFADAQPNAGHRILAQWEQSGKLTAVITQNIDGLHQIAGCQKVLELHGTARYVACLGCGDRYDAAAMVDRFLAEDVPLQCPRCSGWLKHATVSFGQTLPRDVLEESARLSEQADVFLAMGSSLVVHPAASLPPLAKESGARLVIINREPTPQDDLADAVIHGSIGETLVALDQQLKRA